MNASVSFLTICIDGDFRLVGGAGAVIAMKRLAAEVKITIGLFRRNKKAPK